MSALGLAEHASSVVAPASLTSPERRRTVLVVDDDEAIRECLAESLESWGYEVAVAADGQDAVDALLEGLEPDLVVLDLVMPNMDGWAVLKWLRADRDHADRPVLVTSATVSAPPIGASAWLQKPFQRDEFQREVAQLCNHERAVGG